MMLLLDQHAVGRSQAAELRTRITSILVVPARSQNFTYSMETMLYTQLVVTRNNTSISNI